MTSKRSVLDTARPGGEVVVAISRPELRHAISSAFRAAGCSVWTTYDGRRADRRLQGALRPGSRLVADVVVADHALIGRSGFDLVAEARSRGSFVPFVLIAPPGASAEEVRFDPLVIVVRYPLRARDICDAAAVLVQGRLRRCAVGPGGSAQDVADRPSEELDPWHLEGHDRVIPALVTDRFSDLRAASERRARPRAAVELSVDLASAAGTRHARCTSLSAGGMFLRGAEHCVTGELLVNRFKLPGQDGRIRTLAEVVRRVEGASGSSGFGARFVRISPAHVDAVAGYVIDRWTAGSPPH